MKPLLIILPLLVAQLALGDEVRVQYRLTGLFQPDRVEDLRRQAGTLPANRPNEPVEVRLVGVNYDTTVVTFSYDAASSNFRNQKPDQIRERINNLLRGASRGAFSITDLRGADAAPLRKERIAVAGHDCKGCAYGAYRAIAELNGVERAVVSFKEGHVTAWIDLARTNRNALMKVLRKRDVHLVVKTKKN
ncbi:heavy-metal-associated domain-containing protein [Opitutales bacterium]|jgi:copper chaperone CopZ|nr:heavy-metal-associated domain-containing protein [Opitutales bacterium]